MQVQMLLQIAARADPSPALRQIVAAAYQMEIDARRELAHMRLEQMSPQRQWFA